MARLAEGRRWWHNPLRSLLVIAVLAGGMVGVTASPAAAACNGSSCQGLDPGEEGCGGPTLEGLWYTHWSVELRSSALTSCNARWARITVDYGRVLCCNHAIEIKVERQQRVSSNYPWSAGGRYTKMYYAAEEGSWWTKMVQNSASPDRTRACYRDWVWNGGSDLSDPSSWECTSWFG